MKKTALGRIRNRRGMTLIELSIVIVVLGIIIGLVTYGLRTAGAGAQDGANKLKIQSQETMLKMQWQNYENEFGSLSTGDDLRRLTKKDPDHPNWVPVAEKDIMDPWNVPYFICQDEEQQSQLCSKGADKKEGGTGKDADFMLTRSDLWPSWLTGKKPQQQ